MLTMNQINNIRFLKRTQGKTYKEVEEITGTSYKTIEKYEEIDNLTPKIKPTIKRTTKLDPFKKEIRKWLISDKGRPYKQRQTAKRIHNRLLEKYSNTYTASYRTLAKFVTSLKKELNLGKEEFLELKHFPDEAQVDFGKANFIEKGKKIQGSYLVLTLPYSNAGFVQLFRGETQECLLEGLKNIFNHIGKVPSKIWFDNLSATVKVFNKKERKLNKFFENFCAHYSFKPIFCNPASGNEKGNVENKVGYFRRNYLVPEPEFNSLENFNKHLLALCETDHKRIHYQKRVSIQKLYDEQLQNMQSVNPVEFEVFRIEKRKANKYGNIEFETNIYSVSPKEKNSELWIKIAANDITIENTEFYQTLPSIWKEFLKDKDKEQKRRILKVLEKILLDSSMEIATLVLQQAINAGTIAPDSILAIFYRYIDRDLKIEELESLPEKVPKISEYEIDLGRYDKFLGGNIKLKLGREFLDDFEDIPFTTKEEYLANVLKRAFEYQQINRKNRLLKQAKFEIYKSLENYDYSNVEFPETLNIEGLVEEKFIENKENLIFYGPVGTGKTHFATALGIEACNRGKKVRFFKVSTLVNELLEAYEKGELRRYTNNLNKYDLLICDEW